MKRSAILILQISRPFINYPVDEVVLNRSDLQNRVENVRVPRKCQKCKISGSMKREASSAPRVPATFKLAMLLRAKVALAAHFHAENAFH